MSEVINKILKLEESNDIDNLYSYLIHLVKYGDNPISYEHQFAKYFDSNEWQLRKASVFCLLFALQIDKPEYRKKAVEFVNNKGEDEEVRVWAASGLAQTYQKSKDLELLKLFIGIIEDENESEYVRKSLIRSVLLTFGLTSRDQYLKSKSTTSSLNVLELTFREELTEIRRILK